MKVGLVGFRGSGKSTLFAALTAGRAAVAGDAARGRVATVHHEEDARFRFLVDLWQPKKLSPLAFEIHDTPGMPPPGDSDASVVKATTAFEDLDGLVLVVRAFTTADYFYPRPAPDPAADLRDLLAEFVIADLDKALRRVEKLTASLAKPNPRKEQDKRELALMERVREHLEAEKPMKSFAMTKDEEVALRGFRFLTGKPWFLVVNLPDEGGVAPALDGPFEGRADIPVRLEAELMELPAEDRAAFLADLGRDRLVVPDLLESLAPGLGMTRFYTAAEKEVHVWEVPRGSTAVAAADRIHSDIGRGFIRAEIVNVDEVRAAGDMKAVKAQGLLRLEGRDYVVKDGDILNVRFSV